MRQRATLTSTGLLFLLLCASGAVAEPAAETTANLVRADERSKIEAALPAQAPAAPRKPRKLLMFELNVGYPGPRATYPDHASRLGHRSIGHANLAFTLMGRKTGAFETVVSRDPAVFKPESLRQFDAVCFNNTVGDLFRDAELRRSLVEFVCGGGGLMGIHATTVGFTTWPQMTETWPEFGMLLGARGANHNVGDEPIVVKLDDPASPLNQVFGGQEFKYQSEFFRYHNVYSRDRVRVLLSIDMQRSALDPTQLAHAHCIRPDNDYALAWVRNYGRGRVFHCTIGHNPYVFWDPKMLEFYLGAIQFALGDLPAPTTPSAKLTPGMRAQEKLGWRLALTAYTFHKYTLFEAIDKTAQLGLPYLEGLSFQRVSKDIPKNFDFNLSDDELTQIRLKLDAAGVRLLTYYYHDIPADEAACRRLFEFGRKMGIETFLGEPRPEALPAIDKFCNEYDINVALHNHDQKGSPHYWHPKKVLEACQGRSKYIGACGDVGYWLRAGVDPIEAARLLKDRLLTIQMHDLNEVTAQGHDVPWGTGRGRAMQFIEEIHKLGLKPTAFGLEYSYDWLDSLPEAGQCVGFFNAACLRLAQ